MIVYSKAPISEPFYVDDNTITFTDAVPEEAESLVKGSHTRVPLLLLYDDIICTFPDKAGRP